MGIMDTLFNRPQQPQQQPQQNQTQVQPSAAPGGMNNPANTQVPSAAPGTTGQRAAVDANLPQNLDKKAPLDEFAKLWEPPALKEGQKPDMTKFTRPKLDPAKFNEGVSKMSFTRGLDPQLVTKALSGDAEAFMAVLEGVGREAFSNSFQAAERYNGQLIDHYDKTVSARIPKEIGRQETRQLLIQSNKGLEHPSVLPLISQVQKQFEAQFPDASPAELKEAATRYLKEVATLITTSQSESDNGNTPGRENSQRGSQGGVITDFANFDSVH